ncbi:DUF1592 domain-containing protein [bacterium]|nr:DUF1592 domain-containing protein [bacterium]
MLRHCCLIPVLMCVGAAPCFAQEQAENSTTADAAGNGKPAELTREIRSLLDRFCVKCHGAEKPKGDFDLTAYDDADAIRKDRTTWRRVLHVVREEEMPPEDPLPTVAERQTLTRWLDAVTKIDWSKVRNPGHVTIPRLTRTEYANTLRDLLSIDLQAARDLSEDGEGNSGFNTDRDALYVTPEQLEKYFEAAERALGGVLALKRGATEQHFESEKMFMTETREMPQQFGDDFFGYVINRGQMTLYDSVEFPADGYYEFRIRARSTAGPTGTRLRINDIAKGDLVVPSMEPDEFALTTFVTAGSHQMAWNIQVPPTARQPARQKKRPPQKSFRPLPNNAGAIVNQMAPKNAPRYPATGGESPEIRKLIQAVDSAAHSLQRPFEWLRLLKDDGDPREIVRFKGYIEERTVPLNENKTKLAEALGETREQFDARYAKANNERLEDNAFLLERVQAVTAAEASQNLKPGSVAIDWVKIRGPLVPPGATPQTHSDPVATVFVALPGDGVSASSAARQIVSRFASRAFRRPVTDVELERFVSLYQRAVDRGDGFDDSVTLALTGVLVSPQFLFRPEAGPGDDEFRLDDYQLASRLSYFLWMSMPDDELTKLAAAGQLRNPDVLRKQVARLLNDSRSEAFASAFTGQWLSIAALGTSISPDPKRFPQFSPELAESMKRETLLTFLSIARDDRSVLELLDSREAWLDGRLAQLYGLKGPTPEAFQRVALDDRNRGGLLGMASVLTATSSPTRTSPVIRGKWVLETLLGRTLPEPPADVPVLPEDAGEARTLREELLIHRRNPSCAACHDKIDPIGFGLETFDAIGRFRTQQGSKPIDARGELPGGVTFDGPVELKEYLVRERKTEFLRNLTQRLLSFALGRELQYFDEPVIEKIVAAVEADNDRARTLIEQIVLSYPFQYQTARLPAAL